MSFEPQAGKRMGVSAPDPTACPSPHLAEVIGVDALGGAHHVLHVRVAGAGAAPPAPGRFVMLRPGDEARGVFLGRPLSYLDAIPDGDDLRASFYIKVHGPGSRALVELRAGDAVHHIGPLGTGMIAGAGVAGVPFGEAGGPPLWLVGGGVGIAPIAHFLADAARAGGDPARFHLFYGGRSALDLPFLDTLEAGCGALTCTTEDGTVGQQGRVTDALAPALAAAEADGRPPVVFCCGPTPMMAAVAALAARHGARCLASLETRMACGFGVCLGCAVQVGDQGYLRACVEGPVFDAAALDFTEVWL